MTGQKIILNGKTCRIVDALEKVTIPDSYVFPSNKTGTGAGHRELYLASKTHDSIWDFLGGKDFEIHAFFLKKDLLKYLDEVKEEYFEPQQNYQKKNSMPKLWKERVNTVEGYGDVIEIDLVENLGRKKSDDRLYIVPKGNSIENYDLIRKICLPNITYVSIIKLKCDDGGYRYYFRPFIDYFGDIVHPIEIQREEEKLKNESISDEEKVQIVSARKGQGKYRKGLLELCPYCPITMITDDRLLIASHIKPWARSDNFEKIDPKNGFMLTPTYDFLFDRGYISFSNQKEMLISPWLSNMTCSKLSISPMKKYFNLPIEGREGYLEYHRANIFKG